MSLKSTWADKVDGIDDVLAEDINSIANAVIELEESGVGGGLGEPSYSAFWSSYCAVVPADENGCIVNSFMKTVTLTLKKGDDLITDVVGDYDIQNPGNAPPNISISNNVDGKSVAWSLDFLVGSTLPPFITFIVKDTMDEEITRLDYSLAVARKGEDGDSVSEETIAQAVEDYLTDNPIGDGFATTEYVDNLFNSIVNGNEVSY